MNLADPNDVGLTHVPASLLATLSSTSGAMTIRQLARSSGVSLARAQHWVNHWAERGVVIQRQAGSAVMYSVNYEHLMTPSLLALARVRETMIERIAADVADWDIPPLSVTAFGSFARGDGSITSDIDLLVVHESSEQQIWHRQLESSAETLEHAFGNPIQWLDFPRSTWLEMCTRADPLVAEVRRDAIHIFGEYLTLISR